MADALVLLCHPDPDRYSDALAQAWARGATAAGAHVDVLALRDLAFDPILRTSGDAQIPMEPDLRDAQNAILAASCLVFAFPVWWASAPALLKGFIDRAFLPGFAYQHRGGALPEGLLAGRSARLITSMDSPWWWYRLAHGRAAHRAMTTATLRYCGITDVRETTVYRLRNLTEDAREAALDQARRDGEADGKRLQRRRGKRSGGSLLDTRTTSQVEAPSRSEARPR